MKNKKDVREILSVDVLVKIPLSNKVHLYGGGPAHSGPQCFVMCLSTLMNKN